MKRKWNAQILKTNPTKQAVILLVLLLAALFCNLVVSQSVGALSLSLSNVTDSLTNVLTPSRETVTVKKSDRGSEPAQPSQSSASSSSPAHSATTNSPQYTAPASHSSPTWQASPRTLTGLKKQPLLPVVQTTVDRDQTPTATLATARVASSAVPKTGWLKPSQAGWKFLGVYWYWWLATAGVVIALFKYRQLRSKTAKFPILRKKRIIT